jgi:Fe-S cluster biogenesis protein NfuA
MSQRVGSSSRPRQSKEDEKVTQEELQKQVEQVLEEIRPYLEAHGGDVELVAVTGEGQVQVRLQGACSGCPMSEMTLRLGIEQVLKEAVPEVKEVVQVA